MLDQAIRDCVAIFDQIISDRTSIGHSSFKKATLGLAMPILRTPYFKKWRKTSYLLRPDQLVRIYTARPNMQAQFHPVTNSAPVYSGRFPSSYLQPLRRGHVIDAIEIDGFVLLGRCPAHGAVTNGSPVPSIDSSASLRVRLRLHPHPPVLPGNVSSVQSTNSKSRACDGCYRRQWRYGSKSMPCHLFTQHNRLCTNDRLTLCAASLCR